MTQTKKTKSQANKSKTPRTSVSQPVNTRRRKPEAYQRFHFSKRIKYQGPKLNSGWNIFWQSVAPLRQHWKLIGGILLIYALLILVFVRGFGSNFNLPELKAAINDTLGSANQLSTGITLFGVLLGSVTGSNQVATTYQTILVILASLTLIWTLRQLHNRNQETPPRLKDSFYKSAYPLVQFLLVMVVAGLQLIPLFIGGSIYSAIISNGLAVGPGEQIVWAALFFLLAVWSLYMLVPTILALFIVTLPDMTPMRALRSARELVRYRRWAVLRKLLFLPLMMIVLMAIIMLPIILWLTPVAEWSFFALSLVALAVIVSYGYCLYRELL